MASRAPGLAASAPWSATLLEHFRVSGDEQPRALQQALCEVVDAYAALHPGTAGQGVELAMHSAIIGAQMLYKALLGEQPATEIDPGCRERLPQALLEAARINQDATTAYAALARHVLHGNGGAAAHPPAVAAPPSSAAAVSAMAAATEAGPRGEPPASLGMHPVYVSEQELAVLCALRGDPGSAASLAVWLAARLGGHELVAPPLPPPPPPPPSVNWLQAELAMECQLAGPSGCYIATGTYRQWRDYRVSQV